MEKIKVLITTLFFTTAIVLAFIVLLNPKDNTSKENENDQVKENTGIDEKDKCKLISLGQDEKVNKEVLKYINDGGFFTVQDEMEKGDGKYKLIQINMIDHEHNGEGNGQLADYFRDREDLNTLFIENSTPDNVINVDNEEKLGDFLRLPLNIFEKEYDNPLVKKYFFYRDKDFEFVENWIISVLVEFDKDGIAKSAIVYKGAVGLNLVNDKQNLQLEVFVADKMSCIYYAKKDKNGEIINDCGGLIEGNVYIMNIDAEGKVSDVVYVRRSCDNEYTQLCNKNVYEYPQYIKNVVKNYDMDMKYFVENIKEMAKNEKEITEYKTHEVFGERHSSSPEPSLLYVYFTKDNYVVFINRKGIYAKYIKMSVDEYAKIAYQDLFDIINKSEDVLIDGEINPELVKELELTK